MSRARFEVHSHTEYSNIKLLDSINKPKDLIDRAIELGLAGIAITDHDCLSAHVKVNKYAQEIIKEHPNFKVALGNEIYLCKDRSPGQKYFHFILIAKNLTGYRALRELSSRAWMNSYYDRGMERVVTTYNDLREMAIKYPNSLIATTACLGGEMSTCISALVKAEATGNEQEIYNSKLNIINFINMCKELFADDFYLEVAPAQSKEQIAVNRRMKSIADAFGLKIVIGTDGHYLKREDRYAHEKYLNSKGGEREVASFYEYAYLQSEDEIIKNLVPSGLDYDTLVKNSYEIYEKIENFSLKREPIIPKVKVPEVNIDIFIDNKYKVLNELKNSKEPQERYWVSQCLSSLVEKGLFNEKYLSRLEKEADIVKTVGKALNDCVFSYFNTFQHYIDLFWESGSIVGPGRGSAGGFLSNYLMGITQLDPIQWGLFHWRFMNKDRVDELPDIDIDLTSSRRPLIIKKIKEERGENFNKDVDELSRKNLGCTLIATFGTEGTKSTVLTAARGYRSEEFPDGLDTDMAQYIASLVPQERGFLWNLNEVVYGNPEKERKPVKTFINEVEQYPGLLDIMFSIENLVNKRSSHASGVLMLNDDPYEIGCFMKTPKGEIITQWSLHDLEWAGGVKFDFLITEVTDKLVEALTLLQKKKIVESDFTLRQLYNKYLHPQIIDINDKKIWDALADGSVLDCFQ